MIKNTTLKKTNFVLEAAFDEKSLNKAIIKKENVITELVESNKAFIFLGKKRDFNKDKMTKVAKSISKPNRDYEIDIKTFVTKDVPEGTIVRLLVEEHLLVNNNVFTMKTNKKAKEATVNLFNLTKVGKEEFKIAKEETDVRNWARSFQIMPPNVLNSENYADMLKEEFSKIKNVSVKVLNKKQIETLKMGLLLGVNRGSEHEPRVVIVEYKGNPTSKDKTVIVGKGIMFDSGGYSLKPGRFMLGMKYDMSGTAIAAGAMKLISKNKPKKNISIVLPLTDNKIGKMAQTTDSVQISMNGKSVEINNTDAEGRLALADGITYAVRKLKATKIIDVATLTGAVLTSLGNTYTGVWATDNKDWSKIEKAANTKGENIWRMPFHSDFSTFIKGSKIADLKNTDLSGLGGSSSAAMFLKEFTENVPYVHLDVAGTADVKDNPTGVMIKTLAEFVNG